MQRVFDLIEMRGGFAGVRWLIADRPVYTRATQGGSPSGKVTALSPSDAEYAEAMHRFGLLPGELSRGRRVSSRGPNHTAVALVVEVEAHSALLGSDLEETGDPQRGWSAVLAS